jgi:hypothetical protein
VRALEYTHERLWATVLALAVADGTVQERLANAVTSQLLYLSPDDLPLDMRDHFIQIEHRLTTKDPVGDRDSVHATAAVMDEFEARSIVEAIVAMYGEICRRTG